MKFPALLAIILAGFALPACAPRYYDGYYADRDYGPHGDRYDDRYYAGSDRAPAYYGDWRDQY